MSDKKAVLSTQPYKGTRDFYPQEMRIRNWIFDTLRKTLKSHGFEEYDGPMIEPFELYASKTSEEIVNEQLYWLIDRGERKIAIRPEMTPTLARMVAAKQNELVKPLRWFSIPNLLRYERPQRGRLREHWQLNVDVFGGSALSEDLEICNTITAIMNGFGAKPDGKLYEVRINHRGLTNAIFTDHLKLTAEQIPTVSHLLDAAPKLGKELFATKLTEAGLNSEQTSFLVHLLEADAPSRIEKALSDSPHFQHLKKLLDSLKEMGLHKACRFDPSIMRGFQYYTGMVVEVFDLHPENNRALFGGGRYDNLVGMFGGSTLPGVGFGMGDVTFKNFLEVHALLPEFKTRNGVYVSAMDESLLVHAQKLANTIRSQTHLDIPVMASLSAEKPKKSIPNSEKLGCRFVVFVGPDDVAKNEYPVKDLVKGIQETKTESAIGLFVEQSLQSQ